MKQFILLPLLALFLLNATQAQNLNYGAKAGIQSIHITHVSDGKNALLYHIGGFVELSLLDRLHAQAELLFSAQGLNDSESDDYKQRNMYIQLPIIAKYQVWNRLSVHAGVQAGALVSAKLKIKYEDGTDSYNNKEDFKKLDLGLIAGAEYLATRNIGIGARVNWGLSEVFTDYDKSRQRVYQLYATYRLNGSDF